MYCLCRSLFLLAALVSSARLLAAQTAQRGSASTPALERGEAALKANDLPRAAEFFREVLKADPGNVEANADLGVIAFLHGDCTVAEPHFRSALGGSPGITKVQALLSVCERRLGEPSALADMESAFAKLDDPKLRQQIGVEIANAYYQAGEFEKTLGVLHTLLTNDPENVDLLFFAQRVYSELADDTLNKLAVLSPGSARMEQLIAERLINAGDVKNAIVHYRKAVALGPKLPGLHFELAEALMQDSPNRAETRTEVRAQLHEAIQMEGDNSKIECVLGRLADLDGNTSEAYADYKRAFDLNPKDADAQIGLGVELVTENKPEEAARYLRLAVKSDPFNPEAHYRLAQLDKQLHLPEEAKQEQQLFLEIRSTREKVKALYRQMNPGADKEAPAADNSTP